MSNRSKARDLAREHLNSGDATGWFEILYARADGNADVIPWADLVPNPNLVAWAERERLRSDGHRALVVGCGLGDDAEYLAGLGFETIAFDIAPTAIDWCRRRFPESPAAYRVADLFRMPGEWRTAFDLVVEAYTLQSLPVEMHGQALSCLASTVRPGGRLLVICRGRDAEDERGKIPWPLSRADLAPLTDLGLEEVSFEDYVDDEHLPVRRLRVVYRA